MVTPDKEQMRKEQEAREESIRDLSVLLWNTANEITDTREYHRTSSKRRSNSEVMSKEEAETIARVVVGNGWAKVHQRTIPKIGEWVNGMLYRGNGVYSVPKRRLGASVPPPYQEQKIKPDPDQEAPVIHERVRLDELG